MKNSVVFKTRPFALLKKASENVELPFCPVGKVTECFSNGREVINKMLCSPPTTLNR